MWTVKQGNTSVQDIAITDKNGDAVTNLADAQTIVFQVKTNKSDGTPLIEKTKGDGITVLGGDDLGKLKITLVPSDTENLECGKLLYMALEIKWDDTTVYEINLSFDNRDTDKFMVEEDVIS
jgi:hypothetical protein